MSEPNRDDPAPGVLTRERAPAGQGSDGPLGVVRAVRDADVRHQRRLGPAHVRDCGLVRSPGTGRDATWRHHDDARVAGRVRRRKARSNRSLVITAGYDASARSTRGPPDRREYAGLRKRFAQCTHAECVGAGQSPRERPAPGRRPPWASWGGGPSRGAPGAAAHDVPARPSVTATIDGRHHIARELIRRLGRSRGSTAGRSHAGHGRLVATDTPDRAGRSRTRGNRRPSGGVPAA
jgi:hypothetical protein